MEKVIAKSGISGSTLKLIAIFTMLIDHIAATVILQMINNGIGGQTLIDIYWVMRSIGRMAFPVFCFLLVEGFKYTHSREKYAARMFIFALISEIPFDLAINNTVLEFKSNNVFFTLLLGLLAITVLDWLKSVDKIEKASSAVKWFFVTLIRCIVMVSVVLVMMIIAEFVLCCDYGAAGVHCHDVPAFFKPGCCICRGSHTAWTFLRYHRVFCTVYAYTASLLQWKKRHFTKICLLRLLPGASFCTVSDMQACYGCCSHLTE